MNKQEIIDIAGDKYFYEEEKADLVYVDSYTFDGKEIEFYFDHYYGLSRSHIIKDGKKINLYDRTDFKSKDLSKIFHLEFGSFDMDVYQNGEYIEPTSIENEKMRVYVYEFDTDASIIAFPKGEKTKDYKVIQCKQNQRICSLEMTMDLNLLQEKIESWDRVLHIDELPHYSIFQSQFYVKSNFSEYVYLHTFDNLEYHFSTGMNEDGSGYVEIWGKTSSYSNPTYRLTKQQMNDFMEFINISTPKEN